jgi:hypothetical protein
MVQPTAHRYVGRRTFVQSAIRLHDRTGALLRWNTFDAEKDDAERHEKAMVARASLPRNENTVIRDTWKQVSIVNGTRIVHRAETTTIPRYNDKSLSNPKGKTTDQSLIDVLDDLTQLDLSNASPSNPKGKTTDQSLIDVSDLP